MANKAKLRSLLGHDAQFGSLVILSCKRPWTIEGSGCQKIYQIMVLDEIFQIYEWTEKCFFRFAATARPCGCEVRTTEVSTPEIKSTLEDSPAMDRYV